MAQAGTKQVSRTQGDALKELFEKVKVAIEPIKYVVVVMSGKGGVGKSIVSASLAIALKELGKSVAILDADIHGPSIPWLMGVEDSRMYFSEASGKILPVRAANGVGVVSIELALDRKDAPLVWRGPLKTKAITDLISMTDWSGFEYLIVDLPPGTGDEALTVTRFLSPKLSGILLVLTPGRMVAHVVRKAKNFAYVVGAPILGAVANMSYFRCPSCGATYKLFGDLGDLGVDILAELPLDPKVSEAADSGSLAELINSRSGEWVSAVLKLAKEVIRRVEGSS